MMHEIETLLEADQNPERALELAVYVQHQRPDDGKANFLLARAMVFNGQYQQAIKFAQRAVDVLPHSAEATYLAGRLYLDHKLYEHAAPLLRNAVQTMPQSGVIHWAMADFHAELLNGEQAISHYETAINLLLGTPQYDDVKFDYGKCLEFVGRRVEADKVFSELQQSAKLGEAATERRAMSGLHGLESKIAGQLKLQIENDQKQNQQSNAHVLLAMGNMFEKNQQYDQAFEHWRKARKISRGGKVHLNKNSAKSIKQFYSPGLLHKCKEWGHTSKLPLFIVGMPRSGTTLTEQIMSSHSRVAGVGELGRMALGGRLFTARNNMAGHEKQIILKAQADDLKLLGEEYLKLLDCIVDRPHDYVVDKTPTHFEVMGYIHLCFPNAKFINCQRHPADSFISSYQNGLSQFHSYAYDQLDYANAFLAKEDIMRHWKSIFPNQIFDLKYEDMVTDPRGTVQKMLAFIGLEWEEGCMNFFQNTRAVRTISKSQVKQDVYSSSQGRWKNYERHLKPLFEVLGKAGFKYQDPLVSC